MECEKCGAELDEGAEACPECGEPVPEPEAVTAVTSAEPEPEAVPEPEQAEPRERAAQGGNRKWLTALIALVVIVGLGVGGYFAFKSLQSAADSPEAAVMAMLKAYAAYDAQGILDTATHASLPADGVKEFEKQAAEAKKRAGGKPGVKDFKVISTTKEGADQATVEITGQWLTDAAKGTYTKRNEKLTVVKQDGKWLVRLF